MRTFKNTCAQGDVFFERVDSLPEGLTEVKPEKGQLVVTHSETGHNHVMVLDRPDAPNVRMFQGDDPLTAWLQVNRPTTLEHQRPYDTHEAIQFSEGTYRVRRQREYTPEGFRRVED